MVLTDSILETVKLGIGIDPSYECFDEQIFMHINSVFCNLQEFGVGPKEGFIIENEDATWSDYLENEKTLYLVKTYMVQKVKMVFDPPNSGALMDALKSTIAELEWRIIHAAEMLKED